MFLSLTYFHFDFSMHPYATALTGLEMVERGLSSQLYCMEY